MKRFLFIALFLLMTSVVSVTGSIGLGLTQSVSAPFLKANIDDCNKAPCVQGIIPGVTSWREVTARFAGDPDNLITKNSIVIGTNTPIRTTLTADTTGEKVFAISVAFTSPSIPLSTLFAQYGMPCKFRTYSSGNLAVIYPQLTASFDVAGATPGQIMKLSADSKIAQMYFYALTNLCRVGPIMSSDLFFDEQWHSFADVEKHYGQAQ